MPSCNDRRRLAEQFALAAREHSDAVVRLVQHEGPPSHAEYGALRSVVNETRERCESAGVEFDQHVALHGCGVSTNKFRLAKSAHASASASIGAMKQKAISA
jgi:hypothetical protein